jgi:hypothetical protein
VENRTIVKSVLLVVGIAAVFLLAGLASGSSPSDDVAEAARLPTSTTTTEPPLEGVFIIRISNGSFRPSNVLLDLDEVWNVKWVNDDPREYVLADMDDRFETTLAEGAEFEFDYSTLEPGIYRVSATVGRNKIPGTIDTRPEQ